MHHFTACIQESIIHVDIYDKSSVIHLFACNGYCLFIVLFFNKSEEFPATCHIASLTNIDESDFWRYLQLLKPGKPHVSRFRGRNMRTCILDNLCQLSDVTVGRSATSSNNIYKSLLDNIKHLGSQFFRTYIILPHAVRKSRIWIGTDI